ncbi:MAG: Fe-Mn family superoxide dismutase [Candidatus Taylorbacteria bacterium]|nr:Fe-Mn family superoxide dismutase [Candidatus Taylorbacteria bacterium]
MKKFEEKKFNIPTLKGISAKTIEEHLKLYAGYVKNLNDTLEGKQDIRRLGFEYNGMRNHEVYFASLEDGHEELSDKSHLRKQIESDFSSFDNWLSSFRAMALTRGIGWAMLYYDRVEERLISTWVEEQHISQLQDCSLILALDMWEHSFVADYSPSGKKDYVEDFFLNLNWKNVLENFVKATK